MKLKCKLFGHKIITKVEEQPIEVLWRIRTTTTDKCIRCNLIIHTNSWIS